MSDSLTLSLQEISLACEACITLSEALQEGDPMKVAFLRVGKRLADVATQYLDQEIKDQENGVAGTSKVQGRTNGLVLP